MRSTCMSRQSPLSADPGPRQLGVDWSFRVALRTTGGSSWICQGADAEIIVPSPNGRQRCLVSDVRPLTPAEVAAIAAS